SHDLNFSNRPVRTRMPGGVAGERPERSPPMPIVLRALSFERKSSGRDRSFFCEAFLEAAVFADAAAYRSVL
ncbi:MAG: hypothetical protein ACLQDM_07445, partial [Bradyrhizobium sp.]